MTTKTPETNGAVLAPAQNVIQAMTRVMEDIREVKKTGEFKVDGRLRYNFRGVDDVVNAVGPALRKHGLVVAPAKSTASYRDVTTAGGKASRECTVDVTYNVYGPGGVTDFIPINVPGEALDSSDKGTAQAMSVAFRIALLQAFTLPTDNKDPDDSRLERDKPAPAPVVDDGVRAKRIELARSGKAVGLTTDDLDGRSRDKFRKPVASLSEAQLKTLLDDLPDPDPA